jgi:hypothetical protein
MTTMKEVKSLSSLSKILTPIAEHRSGWERLSAWLEATLEKKN